MTSKRAKVTRNVLKALSSKKVYSEVEIDKHRKQFERNVSTLFPQNRHVKMQHTEIAGVKVAWLQQKDPAERTIIYIHGGGFVVGSIEGYQQHMARLAKLCNAKVLAIDYSLAPEHPYPAALNEIEQVWEELVGQGLDVSKTAIVGDSAGGNLTMAAALRFKEHKLPQPACLVMLSPVLDGTFSGESYKMNEIKEPFLTMDKFYFFLKAYLQGHSKEDPFVSPVFADLSGLPPFLTQVGSDELVRSDSETIVEHAKRDGVQGSLSIGDNMWHSWQMFVSYIPEAKKDMQAIADYILSHTKSSLTPTA